MGCEGFYLFGEHKIHNLFKKEAYFPRLSLYFLTGNCTYIFLFYCLNPFSPNWVVNTPAEEKKKISRKAKQKITFLCTLQIVFLIVYIPISAFFLFFYILWTRLLSLKSKFTFSTFYANKFPLSSHLYHYIWFFFFLNPKDPAHFSNNSADLCLKEPLLGGSVLQPIETNQISRYWD